MPVANAREPELRKKIRKLTVERDFSLEHTGPFFNGKRLHQVLGYRTPEKYYFGQLPKAA